MMEGPRSAPNLACRGALILYHILPFIVEYYFSTMSPGSIKMKRTEGV
jgi:hypothetical protein